MLVRPALAARLRPSPLFRPKADRRNVARRVSTRNAILAAFLSPEHPVLTAAATSRATAVPADVCVRVLGSLATGGLLEQRGEGAYSLARHRNSWRRAVR